MIDERYKHLNKYLKEKFGERTLKLCIDGGFTCPNRDGYLSKTGCIFCSKRGSGEHLCSSDISTQVKNYFLLYRSQRANKFIVYFQNFTNTYDSLENLKQKYDAALINDKIVGLQIATRPDCIDEDIAKLLKSYSKKYYVCVELGLQTSNNKTGNIINRCYTSEQFTKAVNTLNNYGIDVIVHIMIGLPNETNFDLANTVSFINMHNIQGLKIHSTYIVKDTVLESMYKNKQYIPISLEVYLNSVSYVLTHISPDLVIHRISGDPPKELLIAPSWCLHKKWVLNGLDKLLLENDLWQGKFYKK